MSGQKWRTATEWLRLRIYQAGLVTEAEIAVCTALGEPNFWWRITQIKSAILRNDSSPIWLASAAGVTHVNCIHLFAGTTTPGLLL